MDAKRLFPIFGKRFLRRSDLSYFWHSVMVTCFSNSGSEINTLGGAKKNDKVNCITQISVKVLQGGKKDRGGGRRGGGMLGHR